MTVTSAVAPSPVGARTRLATALAPGAAAVAVAACAAGIALHLLTGPTPVGDGVTDWWLMQATAALSYTATGGWLARARPRLVTGWLLLTIGTAQALLVGPCRAADRADRDRGRGRRPRRAAAA